MDGRIEQKIFAGHDRWKDDGWQSLNPCKEKMNGKPQILKEDDRWRCAANPEPLKGEMSGKLANPKS